MSRPYYGGEDEWARKRRASDRAERKLPRECRVCKRCGADMGVLNDYIFAGLHGICAECFDKESMEVQR